MSILSVNQHHQVSSGPAIWLAGDPEDLKQWMLSGIAGIVTNTVVLNEMVTKYGQLTEVIKRYLDITDKKVAVEIDGHSTQELLDVGEIFTKLSSRIILKIPMTTYALDAFAELKVRGVETFCTTVFTLPQATAVAQAGATHVLPFCDPFLAVNGDPTKLVRESSIYYRSIDTVSGYRLPSSKRRCRRNNCFLVSFSGYDDLFSDGRMEYSFSGQLGPDARCRFARRNSI